jgi:uncharacterized protein (TIGR04255 family)
MNFKPVNDDHAVVETVFSLHLSNGIPIPNLESLANAYNGKLELDFELAQKASALKDDLPFFRVHEDEHVGILLGRVRPNGDPSWRLSVAVDRVNEIKVTCRSYTRWNKVWEKIERHLVDSIGLLMLGNSDEGRKMPDVVGIGLTVLDQFISDQPSEPSMRPYEKVLAKSIYLADCLTLGADYFQSDIKLRPSGEASVERLNVSAGDGMAFGKSVRLLDIRHELEIRDLNYDFSNVAKVFDMIRPMANELHQKNKSMLSALLTTKAQACIGLNAERAG